MGCRSTFPGSGVFGRCVHGLALRRWRGCALRATCLGVGSIPSITPLSKPLWFKKAAYASVFVTLYINAFAEPAWRSVAYKPSYSLSPLSNPSI